MNPREEVFIRLFSRLREELAAEPDVGLALKAEGEDLTLRVRSSEKADEGNCPYFAVVVGAAETEGAYRISYKPSGVPSADRQVTIVDVDSPDELLGLVRRYVEAERRRRADYYRRNA